MANKQLKKPDKYYYDRADNAIQCMVKIKCGKLKVSSSTSH